MTRSTMFLTAIGLAAITAGTASASQIAQMTTPARNMRCDIRSHTFVSPTQPKSCPLDYGDSFSLGATGAARWTCHGDTALPPPNGAGFTTVGYGRNWTWGPFTCQVRMTGVTCRNNSGKGFFLSKQAARRI